MGRQHQITSLEDADRMFNKSHKDVMKLADILSDKEFLAKSVKLSILK